MTRRGEIVAQSKVLKVCARFASEPSSPTGGNMKLIQLVAAVSAILAANIALAVPSAPLPITPVPIEDGGLLAIAVACLAAGIRIARRKRNR